MSATTATILTVIFGTLFALIGSLALLIFNDVRRQIRDNTRHIESIITTQWAMIWRLNGIEDDLVDRHGYKPPRVIGLHERE